MNMCVTGWDCKRGDENKLYLLKDLRKVPTYGIMEVENDQERMGSLPILREKAVSIEREGKN